MTPAHVPGSELGLDIGGTKTHGVLLDATGEVLAELVLPTKPDAAGVIESATTVAEGCLALAGLEARDLVSVGVGIPGQVDPATGLVRTAVNLGVDHLELGPRLMESFGVPVSVDNDVKAATRGAADHLGATDLTYINFGTGVAAATLAGGRLVRGSGNLAGEIGHLPIDPAAEQCACGQKGCLEVSVGGGGIARRLSALNPPIALPDLVAAADAGDPRALAETDRISRGIATAVQLVVQTQGSSLVAMGGGVVHTSSALLDRARQDLARRAAESPFVASLNLPERVVLVPSEIPIAAIGAALVGRAGLAEGSTG